MIIGLGHRRGVGKNTVANMLQQYFTNGGYSVRLASYADVLKAQCHELYSWAGLKEASYYEINYNDKNVKLPDIGKTPREIWIEYGTTVCRAIYKDTWVKKAHEQQKMCDILIMTDARFPNELSVIKNTGGKVIRVLNSRIPETDDVADTAAKNYIHWDFNVHNNSTVQDLETFVTTNLGPSLLLRR